MGTSKRLILASLVSVMLLMAFMVGLMPSHDADPAGAASGDGRINMVDLVDMMLGAKQDEEDERVVRIRPGIPASTIKVSPEQAAQGSIALPFGATVDADVANEETTVTYVANEAREDDFTIPEMTWTGEVFTEPILSPFNGVLDLGSFVAADQVEASVFVYALVNAVETTKQTSLVYHYWSHAVNHTIQVVDDIDLDNNAFPDNITDIGPGEAWFSQLAFDENVWRDVGILHLDPGNDEDLLKQDIGNMTLQVGNVSVTAPNLAALDNADFYDSSMFEIIDDAWLVLEVAPELRALIDEVDGDDAEEVIAAWAEEVAANQPGGLTGGSPFLNVKIAYRLMLDPLNIRTLDDLSTNRHGDPTGLSVSIEISDLDIEHPDAVELWSYPTGLREAGNGFSAAAEVVEWVLRDEPSIDDEGTSVVAIVDQLSIFGALESVMLLNSVSPNMVPVGVERDLTLAGLFQTNTALNLAEAQAAYEVLVDGESVDFREVDGEAVTAYVGGENFIYVTLPPQTEPGLLDVTVVDIVNEVDSTLPEAIQVVDTVTLTTEITGNVGEASIDVPPSSEEGLPEGTYFIDETVTATLTFDDTVDLFVGWVFNGEEIGDDNPVTVTLEENSTLQAVLEPREEFLVTTETVNNQDAAEIVLAPAVEGNTYLDGTVVSATIQYNADVDTFLGWEVNGVDFGAETTIEFEVVADTHVVALFEEEDIPDDHFRLIANAEMGGSVVLDPPSETGFYEEGTVVTLTAVPETENGFFFTGWVGPNAEDLADASSAETTIVMDDDKEVTATFEQQNLAIVAVEPNEAWFFGGVVAQLQGEGLTDDTILMINGEQVHGFRAQPDGNSLDFIVPAIDEDSIQNSLDVDISVSRGEESATLPNALTYYKHKSVDGLNSTAFVFDASADAEVDVTMNASHSDFGTLNIPVLEDSSGKIYGIARTSIITAEAKETTEPIGLGSSLIEAGEPVVNAPEFSVHMYQELEAAKNTPPAGSALYALAQGLYEASPTLPDGAPNLDAMTFSFPVAAAGLTAADVRNGLSIYGVETAFDYVTEQTTAEMPAEVLYQSELLNSEVIPELLAETDDAEAINIVHMARLYSLNTYSLRSNAPMAPEVVEALLEANPPTGLNGRVSGGTQLEIVSPLGNLAWVDRIEFYNRNGQLMATQDEFITERGENEYSLVFETPESNRRGMMDMQIFLRSAPETPAVTLEEHFEYRGVGLDNRLLLILLALLIALLGLASGGVPSTGHSSGPCFIATAAYGTPMAAEINVLRDVRDAYLLESAAGAAFVDAYYRVSPAIADVVAANPVLATVMRVLLIPVVFLGKVALAMPTLTALVGMSLGAAYMLRRRPVRNS